MRSECASPSQPRSWAQYIATYVLCISKVKIVSIGICVPVVQHFTTVSTDSGTIAESFQMIDSWVTSVNNIYDP
jgi:hypothetical protein